MKKTLIIILVSLLLVLSSCTNDQLKEAIDECKDDPACTEIIDEVIDEELESRGISGGKMTLLEMDTVIEVLENYYVSDQEYNIIMNNVSSAREYADRVYDLGVLNYELEDLFSIYENSEIENYQYLNFKTINPELKQYVIANGIKYIVYKKSNSEFIYEVSASKKFVYTIDTAINTVYVDNDRLNLLSDERVDELLSGIYNTHFFDGEIDMFLQYKDGILYRGYIYGNQMSLHGDIDGNTANFICFSGLDGILCHVNTYSTLHNYETNDLLRFDIDSASVTQLIQLIKDDNLVCSEECTGNYSDWITYFGEAFVEIFGDLIFSPIN